MHVDVKAGPSYAIAYCTLGYNEGLQVEQGAMAVMSSGIKLSVGFGPGGMLKAAARHALGGESFIMAHYVAEVEGAWIGVAPKYPGDVTQVDLDMEGGILLESGNLLAATDGVAIDVKWAGASNIVLHEGATLLHVHGSGLVVMGAYGGFQEFVLAEDESLVVDTGFLAGFSDTMKLKMGMPGGATASVLSGEGLIGRITGPGRVWIQTRAQQELQSWLFPDRAQNTGKY